MVAANRDEISQVPSGGPLLDYEFQEPQQLEKKPKDILPHGSCTEEIEAEDLEDNDEEKESREPLLPVDDKLKGTSIVQNCGDFDESRSCVSVKDKRFKFLGLLILVGLVFGLICGTTIHYNKDQPLIQTVTVLNCSESSSDMVRWLFNRTTIAKYGYLNQTSAEKCGLNMTDFRNLIIVLPHKCHGEYICEIEGHPKPKRYLVKEDSAEMILDT